MIVLERTVVVKSDDTVVSREYCDALELERRTGTKASTWRYWASIGQGPPSWKLGRRRVWSKVAVDKYLSEQQGDAQ